LEYLPHRHASGVRRADPQPNCLTVGHRAIALFGHHNSDLHGMIEELKEYPTMLKNAPIRAYIPVLDVSRARKFYEQILALAPRRNTPAA
jgi:hypothetical protein